MNNQNILTYRGNADNRIMLLTRNMVENNIQDRSKKFAIRIVKACTFLIESPGVNRTLGQQLLRSGTSIGANICEAQSAQSNKDFLHKLEISLKEARETYYWIEILIESGTVKESKFSDLLKEADEIVKILVIITKKLKEK